MKVLFLIRGLPGAGKTTFANLISDFVLSSDMFFETENGYEYDPLKVRGAHAWCEAQTEHAMKRMIARVAVANTFTEEWELLPYIDMSQKYGYQVHSIIVENRHGGQNSHGVSDEKLQMMNDRFEMML